MRSCKFRGSPFRSGGVSYSSYIYGSSALSSHSVRLSPLANRHFLSKLGIANRHAALIVTTVFWTVLKSKYSLATPKAGIIIPLVLSTATDYLSEFSLVEHFAPYAQHRVSWYRANLRTCAPLSWILSIDDNCAGIVPGHGICGPFRTGHMGYVAFYT